MLPQASTRQLRRWFRFYVENGQTKAEFKQNLKSKHDYRRRVAYRLDKHKKRGLWNRQDTKYLRSLVKYMPHLYVSEITIRMRVMSGVRWSESYIYKHLRKLGWSLQVVFERARQIDEQERANYKYALHYFLKNPRQLIFIDETYRGKKASIRRRCWSVVGQSPYLDCFFGSHGRRYSALCAANIDGFIPEACEVIFREDGDDDPIETRGTVDRKRFTQWVRQKLCPKLGKYHLRQDNSIVILDNATIHHSEEIVNLIRATGAKIIYLPPYSPDLNPIELMFGIYKRTLKKYFNETLAVAHTFALQTVTGRTANNFFFHCGVPQVKKIEDEDEMFDAVIAAVSAAALSSVAILNAVTNI